MKRFLIPLSVLLGLIGARANAVMLDPIASFDTSGGGSNFSVNVSVSGLGGEVVSGFDFDLLYTAGLVRPTAVTFTDLLGTDALFTANLFSPLPGDDGVLPLTGLSDLSDPELLTLQSGLPDDRLVLATVDFDILGPGLVEFDFDLDVSFGLDVKGLDNRVIFPEAVVPPRVSEPGTILLMLSGLGLVLAANRRRLAFLSSR